MEGSEGDNGEWKWQARLSVVKVCKWREWRGRKFLFVTIFCEGGQLLKRIANPVVGQKKRIEKKSNFEMIKQRRE